MKVNFIARLAARLRAHPHGTAIGYMMLSTAAFAAMNICVRLASETMDAPLIMTLRNFVTLAILLPFVLPNNFAAIRTTRLKNHFWRSLVGGIGMLSWTYAVTVMPLVHATALSFTAPIMATLFAILILKEHATRRHYMSLAAGFIGTWVILNPSISAFEWNSLIVLFAACCWAITSILIKSLSGTETPLRMVFYMNLFMFVLALPLGFFHWRMPSLYEWLLLGGISLCSIAMHFTMVSAYARAPVVTLMPIDFMRLVYTSVFAYFLFGEISDLHTWVGAAIIIGSAVYMGRRAVKVTPIE